jgi:hypothetical protein
MSIPSFIIRDQNYKHTNTDVFANIQVTGTSAMSANTVSVTTNTTFTLTPTISLLNLATVGNATFNSGVYPLVANIIKTSAVTGQIKQFSVVIAAPHGEVTANCLRLSDNTIAAGNVIRLANVGDYGSLVFNGTDWRILNYGPSALVTIPQS